MGGRGNHLLHHPCLAICCLMRKLFPAQAVAGLSSCAHHVYGTDRLIGQTELGPQENNGGCYFDACITSKMKLELKVWASEALGHDQATLPLEDIEEREEEEVPLRRKRSVHRRARTEFYTPAFAQFHAPRSTDVLPHADISESAGPPVGADKGKAPMPDLEIPAEFLAEDAQARQRLEEEQAQELDELLLRMTDTDWLTLMMQVGTNPALARELLGADVNEDNFIERMTAIKERKKRALAELRYRALKACLTEPPSKRQRVERASSQPSDVPAATTQPADDPDSAGGSSFHPAGSTPMSGSAVPDTAGDPLDTTGTASTVPTSAAMDSAASRHELGISPFVDSDNSSSPVTILLITYIEFLFDLNPGTSEGSVCFGAGVVVVRQSSKDDEIVDPEVDDFLSSESESDDDIEDYIPYSYFRLNPDVDVGLDLWRDVNLLCQSLHSDDVEEFWRTQDDWVVSSWKLYPKSSVHVLDLTHGKTVYMFVDKVYPIRAPLLERMLHHRLTVPPSYCRDVVVAGSVIQTIQDGLRESYECLASAPIFCCLCLLLVTLYTAAAYSVPAALQFSCLKKIYLETWN
ncbi:hypothetical protein Tco_1174023 [Tanacetum coccineum]